MKNSFKLYELKQKKEQEEENSIERRPCVVCAKILAGPYGRWLEADDSEVWTCSKSHEAEYLLRKNNDLRNQASA
jgi:hypothetical protein